jgi:prepilin-type N-terminal cleavage/methylation domain-containing protein
MRVAARAGRRRGFTLAEVMVAMLLFGMLAAFVVGIVNSVLNLWQTGERRGRGDLVFAAAAERFRGDVSGLHVGPRGWLILDEWMAEPAADGRPAWHLPRLRFLADGGVAREADPRGRGAVEVAWMLVPEPEPGTRLCRLMRFTQSDAAARSFREETWITQVARSGAGLVVMDGVAHAEFLARELANADPVAALRIGEYQPFGFPHGLELRLERVPGPARRKPITLDDALGDGVTAMRLRGAAPFAMPDYALIDHEWLRVSGTWPRLQVVGRGERGTLTAPHARGANVWLPEADSCSAILPASGRRLP